MTQRRATEGGAMADSQQDAVRAFVGELEGPGWNVDLIERVLRRMSSEARYQVYAWERPVVGQEAIKRELQRQTPHFSDLRCEILNIASKDSTVFIERLDTMTTKNGPLTIHVAAVFEVDDEGRIISWREYYDSKEITTQVGAEMTTAGARA